MEPVPRPQWASPIEVGVHARSFYSALPERPTREVLRALRGDPKLLGFLERHELGRLEFSGRLPKPTWLGSYDPPSRDLFVNAFRSPESYGKKFHPLELTSVSAAGMNLVEAMQRSLYHEIGHSVLDAAGPEPDRQVRGLFRSGRLDFDTFKALVTRAITAVGADHPDLEMFCGYARGDGWFAWMVQELQKAPSRRVA